MPVGDSLAAVLGWPAVWQQLGSHLAFSPHVLRRRRILGAIEQGATARTATGRAQLRGARPDCTDD